MDRALGEIRTLTGRFFDQDVVEAVFAVHQKGRLEVHGPPPPLAEIFRDNGNDRTDDLAARAAEAESRLRQLPLDAGTGAPSSAGEPGAGQLPTNGAFEGNGSEGGVEEAGA